MGVDVGVAVHMAPLEEVHGVAVGVGHGTPLDGVHVGVDVGVDVAVGVQTAPVGEIHGVAVAQMAPVLALQVGVAVGELHGAVEQVGVGVGQPCTGFGMQPVGVGVIVGVSVIVGVAVHAETGQSVEVGVAVPAFAHACGGWSYSRARLLP